MSKLKSWWLLQFLARSFSLAIFFPFSLNVRVLFRYSTPTHTHTEIKWRLAQIRYGTPPSPGTPLTPPSHTVYRWTMNTISAKNRLLFEADPVNFYANSVPAFQDRQALLSSVARCGIWQISSSEVGGKVSLHKTFWSKLIWRKVVGLTCLHRSNLLVGGWDGQIRIGQKGPDLDSGGQVTFKK